MPHSPFTIHHSRCSHKADGFTLIEVLVALLMLALLALISYRGLSTVLDAREHVRIETEKWRGVAAFIARFERDVRLAAPRPVRNALGTAPAWRGLPDDSTEPRLQFSRFASAEGVDVARRIGYRLNERQEIELWLWPGLDLAREAAPARHVVLGGVTRFELRYLDANRRWLDAWPVTGPETSIPRAVQLHIVLASGEEIVRVVALNS